MKELLQVNSSIDTLLLDYAQTIIRESPALKGLVIIAAQSTTRANIGMTCYRCNDQGYRLENARSEKHTCIATGATKKDTRPGIA